MPEVSPTLKQKYSDTIKNNKKDINILSLSVIRRDGSITPFKSDNISNKWYLDKTSRD